MVETVEVGCDDVAHGVVGVTDVEVAVGDIASRFDGKVPSDAVSRERAGGGLRTLYALAQAIELAHANRSVSPDVAFVVYLA